MNYRKYNPLLLSTLAASMFLLQAGSSLASPVFKSAHPRFAKFAIAQNGSKAMLVAFDESKGTGKGYNTLFADTNYDGKIEASERVGKPGDNTDSVFIPFPQVRINTRFNADAKSASVPTEFAFYYTKLTNETAGDPAENFSANVTFELRQGKVPYDYCLTANFIPSYTVKKAPFLDFRGIPSIKAETKPDTSKEGFTGISLSLMVGKWNVSTTGNEGPMTAALTIRDANGKRIESRIDDLSNFGFG